MAILHPHAGLPTEPGWTLGLVFGLFGSPAEPPPSPRDLAQAQAFEQGIAAGTEIAIRGCEIDPSAISLVQSVPEQAESLVNGLDRLDLLGMRHLRAGITTAGLHAFIFVLSQFMVPFAGQPEKTTESFLSLVLNLREQLNRLELPRAQLCFGGTMRPQGSSFLLIQSPMFNSLDRVTARFTNDNAPWVIAGWDTDTQGLFSIVATSSG